MLYAYEKGEKMKALPKARAICPYCDIQVIAKCGELKVWHWAHEADFRCDPWSECEGNWHLDWKNIVPPSCTEITVYWNGERHRADIMTHYRMVVELQDSSISSEEIKIREKFYQEMIWLFNVKAVREEGRLAVKTNRIEWHHPRKSIEACECPIYLDIGGDEVFWLKNFYRDYSLPEYDDFSSPYAGIGQIETRKFFIDSVNQKHTPERWNNKIMSFLLKNQRS